MKRTLLFVLLAAASGAFLNVALDSVPVFAQQAATQSQPQVLPQDSKMPPLPALKHPPLVYPYAAPNTTPNVCDQSFTGVLQTADGNLVQILPPISGYAIPWKDALDNHDKSVTMLRKISELQNKGGEYTGTFTETVNCDKKGNARIQSGSIYVEGVTLIGTTEIADLGLQVGKEVNDRFKARAKAGMSTGWNHKNGKPVKVNAAGQVVLEEGQ